MRFFLAAILMALTAAEAADPPAPASDRTGPSVAGEGPGTTVIGDQESPIGLYIMPWRNSSADPGLDKPARLLEEAMLPMDRDVFRRQTEYFQTLEAHRAKQAGGAAPSP